MRVAHSHPTTQLASPPNDPHRFAEAAKLLLVALRLLEAMLRPGGVRRRVTRALRWIGLADPAPRVRDTLCAPETRSSDHCGVREKEKGGPGPPYRVHSEGFEPGVTLWTRWISNKWAAAALSAVLVAALYAVSWVVCHAFRISVTYSAFWPPTGVVGALNFTTTFIAFY